MSGQLAKLKVTWAMGQTLDDDDVLDGVSADVATDALREELLASRALRDLLDQDLEHRGVSTPRGGERRLVGQRIQASRDLVRLADRIRTEARRAARIGSPGMSAWEVASDIAFDASQHPSDVIVAVKHLLTHRPPRVTSPELQAWDEKVHAMSEAEIEAMIHELEALDEQPQAATRSSDADEVDNHDAVHEPSVTTETEMETRCLGVLQRTRRRALHDRIVRRRWSGS